jgi:hypothetical protein
MGCWTIDRCEKTQEILRMVRHLSMGQQPRCQIEALSMTYWWHTWIVPASSVFSLFWGYKTYWFVPFTVCVFLELEWYLNCVLLWGHQSPIFRAYFLLLIYVSYLCPCAFVAPVMKLYALCITNLCWVSLPWHSLHVEFGNWNCWKRLPHQPNGHSPSNKFLSLWPFLQKHSLQIFLKLLLLFNLEKKT